MQRSNLLVNSLKKLFCPQKSWLVPWHLHIAREIHSCAPVLTLHPGVASVNRYADTLSFVKKFGSTMYNSCCPTALRTFGTDAPCRGKYRSEKRNQKTSDEDEDDESLDLSDEESGDEADISSITFDSDAGFPDNYKELKVPLKSLRADGVAAAGLKMARNKVDDLFLESKLKLNGERLLKKSKQMQVGDCIDLVISTEGDVVNVKRVRIVKIDDERTSKEKLKVYLRAWRAPVVVRANNEKRLPLSNPTR